MFRAFVLSWPSVSQSGPEIGLDDEAAAERGTRRRSGQRPRRRVRRPDRWRSDRPGRARPAGRSGRVGGRDPARLRRLSRADRHARAPARAGPGAQGDGRERHRRGRRGRLHRGRVHAEHGAGQRQRRRDRIHAEEGGGGEPGARVSRSARSRAARKASSWPISRSCGRPAASRSPTMGIRWRRRC